jgi:hypothetical protein
VSVAAPWNKRLVSDIQNEITVMGWTAPHHRNSDMMPRMDVFLKKG